MCIVGSVAIRSSVKDQSSAQRVQNRRCLNVTVANPSSVCARCQPTAELLTRRICQRKTFFSVTFFRKVSSGSRIIKGVSCIKEIQNESIRSISHCQMFRIKYSAICLFAFLCLMFAEAY